MTDATFEGVPQVTVDNKPTLQIPKIESSKSGWIGNLKARFQKPSLVNATSIPTQQENDALLRTRERLRIESARQKEAQRLARFEAGMSIARRMRLTQIKDGIREGKRSTST